MSSPPPLPAAPPKPSPPAPLADFGDWLSPMIVKELRQGLRTWIFVGAFIVLQAILVMTLLISSSAGNADASSTLFWMLIAAILVFIVPLRGFNALAGEMKAETLDLLMLTRLGAFRIALGKWIALVAQSGLIMISVLPYVVLRYFGGGVDVANELLALLLLWMLSAAVTAIAVAFSALPSVIVRTLVLLATWFFSMAASSAVTAIAARARGMGGAFGMPYGAPFSLWTSLLILIPLWAFGCYFVIDVGASTIAPLASNHATRKRSISLLLMLVAFAFAMAWPTEEGRFIATACLCAVGGLAALDCLTETPTASPSVYVPFVRRGLIGRLAACFLTPGWATGLLFYTLIVGLTLTAILRSQNWNSDQEKLIFANILLTPMTPLALALLFFRQSQRLLGPYIVCSLIVLIASLLFLFMTTVSREDSVAYIGMLTPPSALMLFGAAGSGKEEETVLTGGIIAGFILLLVLLTRAAPVFKSMRHAMREASAEAAADRARTSAPPEPGQTKPA